MPMFAKKIKTIRDMNSEVEVLDRRINREISKLNDNLTLEIKKKFKKITPGIQLRIRKIKLDDFLKTEKKGTPLLVLIDSLNGRKIHTDGVWVEEDHNRKLYVSDNKISVSEFEKICYELSENLDVNVQVSKISGIVNY